MKQFVEVSSETIEFEIVDIHGLSRADFAMRGIGLNRLEVRFSVSLVKNVARNPFAFPMFFLLLFGSHVPQL